MTFTASRKEALFPEKLLHLFVRVNEETLALIGFWCDEGFRMSGLFDECLIVCIAHQVAVDAKRAGFRLPPSFLFIPTVRPRDSLVELVGVLSFFSGAAHPELTGGYVCLFGIMGTVLRMLWLVARV